MDDLEATATVDGSLLETTCRALAAAGRSLISDGLAIGSAGNLSVRIGNRVAITPAAVPYEEVEPADICLLTLAGESVLTGRAPSSETPMHLAIYASTPAGAVVHTHSPEVIALSTVAEELPAIHYAIVGLGGPVRVAPYVRFGSDALAEGARRGLEGRSAVILQNHGAVTYGRDLEQAYQRARLLEWLASVYRLARSIGEPRILSPDELAEVAAEARRRRSAGLTNAGPPARTRTTPRGTLTPLDEEAYNPQ
jgi:L-fuculose-phosphate aldolase